MNPVDHMGFDFDLHDQRFILGDDIHQTDCRGNHASDGECGQAVHEAIDRSPNNGAPVVFSG